MNMNITIIITIILLIVGLIGLIFPILPGIIIIYLGLLIDFLFNNSTGLTGWSILILGIISVASLVIDQLFTAYYIKKYGGSKLSIWLSIVFSIIGAIILNIPGLILGIIIGAAAGEYIKKRDFKQSANIGYKSGISFLLSTGTKLGIGIIMIVFYISKTFF